MSRQPSTYAVPMTPVTPAWAGGHDVRSTQRQRLLPSAIEMTTPPQTVPRKMAAVIPPPGAIPAFPGSSARLQVPPTMAMTGAPAVDVNSISPQVAPNVNPYAAADQSGSSSGSPYGMMEVPVFVPGHSPRGSASFTPQHHSEMVPMPAVSPLAQNVFPGERFPGGFPGLHAYPQFRPHSHGSQPHIGQVPRYPPGRVSKMQSRNPPYPQPKHALPPTDQKYIGPPMGIYRGGTAVDSYQSEIKDRYAAYNHYILRHAAEEKSKVIWSAEVEAAFMEAVWLIPGDSCKILMERRTRGRNELISDYLKHKLGETRSRKQVSSHLQVLKKLLRDDEEFLEYVGPKKNDILGNSHGQNSDSSKSRPDMSASSLAQLITKLKLAKRNQPKPAFLLQAEANLQQSRREEAKNAGQDLNSNGALHLQYRHVAGTAGAAASMNSAASVSAASRVSIPPQFHTSSQGEQHIQQQQRAQAAGTSKPGFASTPSGDVIPVLGQQPATAIPIHGQHITSATEKTAASKHPEIAGEPPLRHPRPVRAHDLECYSTEPVVVPSASVPPKDQIEIAVSPRRHHPHHFRHHSRHHRRTTSTSVDLSGDKVLPVQFKMARTGDLDELVYTRLLRATYESPSRPLELHQLTPKFSDLAKLESENQLAGAQVVHANVALFIKAGDSTDNTAIRDNYSSDVQFVVTCDTSSSLQHRYIAKTVVTSRSTELLRCEIPCFFQRMAGRGLELDKEVVHVPFLPDFWSDFLARLSSSDHEYVEAALSALTMHQAIYRISNDQSELCFVSLYQFSAAQDEFSARTRFRRVKGVRASAPASHSSGTPATQSSKDITPSPPRPATLATNLPAIREPSTPTRASSNLARNTDQSPRPLGTPSLLGIGTPGQVLNNLGTFINCESPSVFASPRRLNAIDNIEIGASPFTAVLSSESRGSPRSSKFEIQRAMTAFEPSAWDEMHDWIYQ